MSTQVPNFNPLPYWCKLRNGNYAKIEEWVEMTARLKGGLYTPEGRRVGYSFWLANMNSLINNGFDIVSVKSQGNSRDETNPKRRGEWPPWTNTI